MKCINIIALFALMNAGALNAAVYIETNKMPAQVNDLMNAEGYAIDPRSVSLPAQNSNSLRELLLNENALPVPLELRTNNVGWTLWKNFTIKRVDRNPASLNESAPASLLQSISQLEYDVKYSFVF